MTSSFNILFFGYGAIVRRYINIISSILSTYKIQPQIYIVRSGQYLHGPTDSNYTEITIAEISSIYFHLTIIASPSISKIPYLQLRTSSSVLIDKPAFLRPSDLSTFINQYPDLCSTPVLYCLRYHPQLLRTNTITSSIVDVNLTSYTNYKLWRPRLSFNNTVAAQSYDKGGGAAAELSHEIDLHIYLSEQLSFPPDCVHVSQVSWSNTYDHDTSFSLISNYDSRHIRTTVDVTASLTQRHLVLTYSDEPPLLIDLGADHDLMYYNMIRDYLLPILDPEYIPQSLLPTIHDLLPLTTTISSIHASRPRPICS